MNTATDTAGKYIAIVVIHDAGDWETNFVFSNPERISPILSTNRKHATAFSSATEARGMANAAIRGYAEADRFQPHQCSVHVFPASFQPTSVTPLSMREMGFDEEPSVEPRPKPRAMPDPDSPLPF